MLPEHDEHIKKANNLTSAMADDSLIHGSDTFTASNSHRLNVSTGMFDTLDFSPDGKMLATG